MSSHSNQGAIPALTLAALGIVYGDIGTSPLYAFKEAFSGAHAIPLTSENVFGVLSMMFWAVTIIVALKYVVIMLRFDNKGDGGVLALLSYSVNVLREKPKLAWAVTILGAISASLFYGDAVITPAMTVMSAVEGINVVSKKFEHFTVPIALVILIALFAFQRKGTAKVGALFGPVMVIWFLTISVLGIMSIVKSPEILRAISPTYAITFSLAHPGLAFIASSAVFLCLTGAEALYADMGHFGPKPVRIAWFSMVMPSLMLNYFGQGALVLRDPEAVKNPFYFLAPDFLLIPMVILATMAAVIASQATISGAFSATQQASRLNLLPRLQIKHTSDTAQGQIYIPIVNWILLLLVIVLVLGFQNSEKLAAAYGIAVAGDLVISSIIVLLTLTFMRGRRHWFLLAFFAFALALELVFLFANARKIPDGGWFPLVLSAIIVTVFLTWRVGMESMRSKKDAFPKGGIDGLCLPLDDVPRVPGNAIFFSSSKGGCPSAFLHNLKHNKVVHDQTAFLTVLFADVPRVADEERVEVIKGENGIYSIVAQVGYREDPDIEPILRLAAEKGVTFEMEDTSFFTSKPTVVASGKGGFFAWRKSLFRWMLQSSTSVASYFKLPPNRVVELGAQLAI
jgi:KUP system potassium uptake protein